MPIALSGPSIKIVQPITKGGMPGYQGSPQGSQGDPQESGICDCSFT